MLKNNTIIILTSILCRCENKATDINSPDSNDSGIQADATRGATNRYGEIHRQPGQSKPNTQPYTPVAVPTEEGSHTTTDIIHKECTVKNNEEAEQLPPGWQKCTGKSTFQF